MWASFVRFGPENVLWHRAGAFACRQHPLLSSVASTVRLRPAALAVHSGHLCCAAFVAPLDEQRDTIAALSSGSGRCGVALLRVSGPGAGETSDQNLLGLRPVVETCEGLQTEYCRACCRLPDRYPILDTQ